MRACTRSELLAFLSDVFFCAHVRASARPARVPRASRAGPDSEYCPHGRVVGSSRLYCTEYERLCDRCVA